MPYSSLRDFITALEKRGDLLTISEPVSTYLEMTEIHRQTLHRGGPALLFEHATQPDANGAEIPATMPVLVNLFGTVERIAFALGRKPDELRELGEMLAYLRQPEPPGSLKEAWEMLPTIKQALKMKPKLVSKAPCQQIVLTGDDIDLTSLPIQICWPGDASPLITWPLVVTQGPKPKGQNRDKEDGYNLGIYRMQLLDDKRTLMRWLHHRGGAQHHKRWAEEKPDPLPVAAVLGADPATTLAAVTPVPDTLSEYEFAGLLRGKKGELVDCKTVPLKVPANAEIVIEGYVSLDEYGEEGPFGDHTGYYNSKEPFPVFTASAITMRKQPIYLSTYTGKPPDEPSVLGEAMNELFIPLLQQQFPEITDCWLPPEGCSYRVAVVGLKKKYPGHARRIMMGVWGFLRQFTYTKYVIVVDHTVDTRNWKDIIWAISTCTDPSRDFMQIDHTPIDYLDFASVDHSLGGKLGIDATTKIGSETAREWGEPLTMPDEITENIRSHWKKMGLEDICPWDNVTESHE